MCGILIAVSSADPTNDLLASLQSHVSRRGPDHLGTVTVPVTPSLHLRLVSSVLHLRGPDTVAQPLQSLNEDEGRSRAGGLVLMFNGEIFDDPSEDCFHLPAGDANDAQHLFEAVRLACDPQDWQTRLTRLLSQLQGPWSLALYHAASSTLLLGRDALGRRSLVWRWPRIGGDGFYVSSVVGEDGGDGWEEVPADGIHGLRLAEVDNARPETFESARIHIPWTPREASGDAAVLRSPLVMKLCDYLPTTADLQPLSDPPTLQVGQANLDSASAIARLEDVLSRAVSLRVSNLHLPCDDPASAPLAILFSGGLDCMVLASLAARALPLGTPVDLLNVAFENPRVLSAAADRQGGGSRKRGRRRGGDTAEADAFDTVGGSGPTPPSKKSIYDVPDRITGRKGFEELCVLHRGVKWQFVEVNVGVDEAMAGKSRVMGLVKPLDTVMDLSIALAFWYASRGIGTVVKDGVRHPYVSRAKVLLSGLGADEQLGGYNRHRTSFERNSWRGLLDELQLDVSRISSRNLGRDDRIISDHGKEVRFPYLAEPVVSYLSSVPVHIKVDPRYPRGHGEKLLLRRLAYRIGLPRAAGEWKRAVQFGARTAKMMDIREKGADKLDD